MRSLCISNITPIVLAGGRGTRLQSLISDRPKVVADVGGRPFITYIFDQLIRAGFNHVILCVGYLAEKMIEILGDKYQNLKIQYSLEPYALGTGGAVKHALPLIEKNHILVMNGDSFIDVDLRNILAWSLEKEFVNLIVLSKVSDVSRYGTVEISNKNAIIDFTEKTAESKSGWVNAGIYLFSKELIDTSMKQDAFYSLEQEIIPELINKVSIGGYLCNSKLIDIGTPKSYATSHQAFVKKNQV